MQQRYWSLCGPSCRCLRRLATMSRELLTSHNPQLSRPTKADNLGCIAISFISEVPDNVGTLIRDSLSVNTQRAYLSVARDMSGFGSTRFVRFSPERSHAAGGQDGPDHRCDWVASSEEAELRGGSGAVGDERAALSPVARRL